MKNIEWYLEAIKHELEELEKGKFTGNMEFKVNFKDGEIANMNIGLNRSLKRL